MPPPALSAMVLHEHIGQGGHTALDKGRDLVVVYSNGECLRVTWGAL